MKTINIGTPQDLQELLYAILKDEEVKIGDIKPIPYALTFQGDRFKVVDGYISSDFADYLVDFRREYKNFLSAALGRPKAKEVDVLFKVENGSIKLDFLNDFPQKFWMRINTMVCNTFASIAIVGLLGYFGHSSFKDNLEFQEKQLQANLQKEAFDVAKEAIKAVSENTKLEKAKNKPIQNVLKNLSAGEVLQIGEGSEALKLQVIDSDKFAYDEDADDVTLEYHESFTIHGFTKEKYGWKLSIKAQAKDSKLTRKFWADSKLTPADNIKLFKNADNGEAKKLKVTVVKNKNDIKEAYITSIE